MAKQETQGLFEESSQGAVSAVTAVVFVLSMVLLVGGIVLMSYAFGSEVGAAGLWIFSGGLAASVIGCILPFDLLPTMGK